MIMGGSTHFSVFLLVAIILLCSSSKTVNATCYGKEKQALMDFKKDLKDPSGRLSSWIHDVDCCKWEGVVCSNRSGLVIQLHLQSPVREIADFGDEEESPLSGKISHSLQNLTHLRYLDLSLNDFSGIPIPSFFGSLRSLRYLNLSGAGFQGMVPYQLGNLSSLRTLSIGGYLVDLQVDNLQWLVGLSNLEHLDISRVNLSTASNWLEVINTIPSLVEIHLSYCHLGLISHQLGRDTFVFHANFSSLAVLDLSGNFLGHLIPRWIFGLTTLASLDLSGTSFEGPLPRDLWNLTSLKHLDLFGNYLNGSLRDELIHLNNLISLNLGGNQFEGSLDGLWNWSSLTSLDLSDNDFTTFLPRQLSTLSSLVSFDLRFNHFRGSIPSSIANISNLQHLDLSYNNLSSSLPSEVFTLKDLITLDASGNHLNGPIPSTVGNCTKLEHLALSDNALSSIPSNLGRCTKLKYVSLGGQSSSLRDGSDLQVDNLQWLAGLSNLEHLDMSRVNLSTASNWLEVINTIPSLVEIHLSYCQLDLISHHLGRDTFVFHANFSSLTVLDLSGNFLGPVVPRWIFGLTALASLDLSETSFEGPLPRGPWNLTSLKHLDLSVNYLNGSVPDELIHLNNLISLNLGWNHLNGAIPSTVGNCTQLKELLLRNNALSGSIPSNLGKLSSLEHLDVSQNKLTGTLPESLGQLSKLEELHIADNLIEGVVSESHLDNLTTLSYFDASGNSLTLKVSASWTPRAQFVILKLGSWKLGPQFPTWIRSQKFLLDLNLSFAGISDTIPPWLFNSSLGIVDLSHNQLHGGISHVLCEVKNENQFLLYLDFRENFLSGEIPDCWVNYPELGYIDLNSNNFTGSIPRSLFHLEDLYHLGLGNNSLTGPITFDFANHE